jgi:predicted metal-dependent hydrolase
VKDLLHYVEYGAERIGYQIHRSAKRQTLGIEVHPNLQVIVRAPPHCGEDLIAQRVRRRAAWISRRLAEFQRYIPRTPRRHYVSGETHLYLGRQHRLRVVADEPASVRMDRGHLIVTVPDKTDADMASALLLGWYRGRARIVFAEVLQAMLPRFRGHQPPKLFVRSMQTRWGSLSPSGNLTLNFDLIRAPRACIEYVVAHELCHLKHRNHSPAFYRLLSSVMPDWPKRKERLATALL